MRVVWSLRQSNFLKDFKQQYANLPGSDFRILSAYVETALLKKLPDNGFGPMQLYEPEVRKLAARHGIKI